MTYLVAHPDTVTPGYAMTVPHRFATGPVLLWRGAAKAPEWLGVIDARLNLVTLGCAALWSVGLRQLDGRWWQVWHVLLPLACLLGAGVITWAVAPLVVPMLMW